MARLGTIDNPAHIRVRSLKRGRQMIALCKKNRWTMRASVVPFQPENIDDIKKLVRIAFLNDNQIKKVGRNDPCPCGSAKKFKKCCLR